MAELLENIGEFMFRDIIMIGTSQLYVPSFFLTIVGKQLNSIGSHGGSGCQV